MGRRDTYAAKRIRTFCACHRIDEDELVKRTRLVLSVYSELLSVDIDDALLPDTSDKKNQLVAIEALEKVSSHTSHEELADILRDKLEIDLFVEIVDTAMCMVNDFSEEGAVYFEILSKCFLAKWKYSEKEMTEILRLDRSRYYDRKREGLVIFGINFWYKAIPHCKAAMSGQDM